MVVPPIGRKSRTDDSLFGSRFTVFGFRFSVLLLLLFLLLRLRFVSSHAGTFNKCLLHGGSQVLESFFT